MKKILVLFLIIGSSIFLSGCNNPMSKVSALQVNSTPKTTVFLNGNHVGQTPYYDEKLKSGDYTIKLVPETQAGTDIISWEGKITLNDDALTVVNRDLKKSENESSGEILNLEAIGTKETGEIMIMTLPDAASIKLDGQEKGVSPLLLKNITAGDHEIVLSSIGYTDRIVRIRVTNGYKVNINAQLSIDLSSQTAQITSTPSGTPSISPITVITPGEKSKITPSPQVTPKTGVITPKPGVTTVKILDTPTGWLRVRMEPSLAGTEAAKVNTGESFPYVEENSGWTKIEYENGKEGWVSSQYTQKVNP
jgi:hypothetical protein